MDSGQIEKKRQIYLRGHCYPFAVALHRVTSLPFETLVASRRNGSSIQENHPAHVWLSIGQQAGFDARGIVTFSEIKSEFLDPYDITEWRIEKHEDEAGWTSFMESLAGGHVEELRSFMVAALPAAEDFVRGHVLLPEEVSACRPANTPCPN